MNQVIKKIVKYLKQIIVGAILIISLITITRFFLFDVYYVPTASMHQTIMPGELILTDKMCLGARWMQGDKLTRLPGFGSIKRNDIVVFNFPEGDTVYVKNPTTDYYMFQRRIASGKTVSDQILNQKKASLSILNRIAYVKRCVGLPGDTISIFDGDIFNNHIKLETKTTFQKRYQIKGDPVQISKALNEVGINQFKKLRRKDSTYSFSTTQIVVTKIKDIYPDFSVIPYYHKGHYVNSFPFYKNWKNKGLDNYGPLYIPKKGDTINVNISNLPIYKRLIEVYENNRIEINNDVISINGKEVKTYIIKQDYYFMVGDNRYQSIDSRNWGFVPEDHLIGKVRMILFSKDQDEQVRWGRLGTVLN